MSVVTAYSLWNIWCDMLNIGLNYVLNYFILHNIPISGDTVTSFFTAFFRQDVFKLAEDGTLVSVLFAA